MSPRYVVGLDMGGTNIRCAAVSIDGEVLLLLKSSSNSGGPAHAVADNLATQIQRLEDAARKKGLGVPRAICAAVPGPLNVFTGTVMAAPHVAAWHTYPLKTHLEEKLGRSVVVENDANAWALGEFWRGAARGLKDVVLLTLGTGVGGGLIVGGKIVHGRSGMAGELGHVTVEPRGMPCDCGALGCLEAYASSSGMHRLVANRIRGTIPARYLDSEGNFSVRGLTMAARSRDRIALSTFATAGHYLGIAIAGFINIFNPELVVLGGGVAGALSFMRESMMKEVKSQAFSAVTAETRIVRAALGPIGGVVGAAYAALNPPRPH